MSLSMVFLSPYTRRSPTHIYKIPAIVFFVFWFGKFCLEKTAQIMIVNSFPPVPRMDHILCEYDKYRSFRFFFTEFSIHCCCMVHQVGTTRLFTIYLWETTACCCMQYSYYFSQVAPFYYEKLGSILKGPRPAYLNFCTRNRNAPFYRLLHNR